MNNLDFWKTFLLKGAKNIKTYFIAQLKLLLLMFIVLAVGLSLIDIKLGILIALGISLLDLLPVIGSGLVFIPWAIIEWIWGSSERGWQLALLYVVATIIKQFAEPYILGRDLRLPFWVPLVVIIICSLLFNVFGILVAAVITPLISAFWEVYHIYQTENKL